MAQSIAHNNNRAIGLLRGAGNRMATFFYSLHRLLRLKPALLATVHTPKFAELTINRRIELAVHDIMNERFWQAIYYLLRAVYPALLALRLCDSNRPGMDKIYYLVHRATESMTKSVQYLNDESIYGELADDEGVGFERRQLFESGEGGGNEVNGEMYSEDSSDRYVPSLCELLFLIAHFT